MRATLATAGTILLLCAGGATAQVGIVPSGLSARQLAPGMRLLTAGGTAFGPGRTAHGLVAAGVGIPLFGVQLDLDAALRPVNDIRASGTVAVAFPVASGTMRLIAGGGVRDRDDRRSVGLLGARLDRGGFSFALTTNLLPGAGAIVRDTILPPLDSAGPPIVHHIEERPETPDRILVDAEIGYRTMWRNFELHVGGGQRIEHSRLREWWASAGAAYAITPYVAVGFNAGRLPASPWADRPGGESATLFVRLAGARPERVREGPPPAAIRALTIRQAGGTEFTIDAPAAQQVEITGDFVDWSPLSLERGPDGYWRHAIALKPGVYRIAVRVDGGEWRAPPGVAVVPDEFGGESGVFEVGK